MNASPQKTAFAIAGALSIVMLSAVYYMAGREIEREMPEPTAPVSQESPPTDAAPLSSDAAASIGQRFIVTLASYDQEQGSPVKLISIDERAKNRWLAKYEVEQMMSGHPQVLFYTLDLLDGRIVSSRVSVSDKERRILVSNPQPSSIIGDGRLIVKGQVFANQDSVDLALVHIPSSETVLKQVVTVEDSENRPYSETLSMSGIPAGEYELIVSDDQSETYVVFVLPKP